MKAITHKNGKSHTVHSLTTFSPPSRNSFLSIRKPIEPSTIMHKNNRHQNGIADPTLKPVHYFSLEQQVILAIDKDTMRVRSGLSDEYADKHDDDRYRLLWSFRNLTERCEDRSSLSASSSLEEHRNMVSSNTRWDASTHSTRDLLPICASSSHRTRPAERSRLSSRDLPLLAPERNRSISRDREHRPASLKRAQDFLDAALEILEG
jgi:hypothetical protein